MHAIVLAVLLGLGIGAKDPNHIVVKIDGTDRVIDLKANASGDAAQKFLQCLVAGRVLKVSKDHVKLLDDNDVADHLREFMQSRTAADPCTLGKAAYTPKH
ncbi:MAG TPA: hypothetical protein VJ901_05270 [Thermoanaerobaculia bacterium]|nr:hypothetical protein [Thermoanaerobaculia bacterium]